MSVLAIVGERGANVHDVGRPTPGIVLLRSDEGVRGQRLIVGGDAPGNELWRPGQVGDHILLAGTLLDGAAHDQISVVVVQEQNFIDVVHQLGLDVRRVAAGRVALRAVLVWARVQRHLLVQILAVQLHQPVGAGGVDAARAAVHHHVREVRRRVVVLVADASVRLLRVLRVHVAQWCGGGGGQGRRGAGVAAHEAARGPPRDHKQPQQQQPRWRRRRGTAGHVARSHLV